MSMGHLNAMLLFSLGIIYTLCSSLVSATNLSVRNLLVSNKNVSPDGFTRSAVVAGDSFPGPVITAVKGQRLMINVTNELTDASMVRATSIHWHGIFQRGSNWADGSSFVTQCPISPQHSFLYDFTIENQSGTYWYHSHISTQYCDGLRGAFIVYDPDDFHQSRYDVDDESTVITIGDWYHDPAPSLLFSAKPFSTLINGKGRYLGGPATSLAIVNVRHGLKYRLRLVSISCYSRFNVSIAGHKLTVIEADGVATDPTTVDVVPLFAGQRYSVILEANQRIGNYWILANTDRGATGFDGGLNSAILRYAGAPNEEPTSPAVQSANLKPLDEKNLRPAQRMPVPGTLQIGGADVNINLELGVNVQTFQASINGVPFVPPTVPVLLQMLSGAHTAQELFPSGSIYTLPRNKVIELTIPGGLPDGPHPFHLHGHNFHVIRSAGSSEYNFQNPIIRDVVSIGDTTDNVTIRFVTDNSGPWFFHCHLDWHLELGLAIVFAEDPQEAAKQLVPVAWKELCPIYDAIKGNLTVTDPAKPPGSP